MKRDQLLDAIESHQKIVSQPSAEEFFIEDVAAVAETPKKIVVYPPISVNVVQKTADPKKDVPNTLKNIWKLESSAFKYTIVNYSALNTPSFKTPDDYLKDMSKHIDALVSDKLENFKGVKFHISLSVEYAKDTDHDVKATQNLNTVNHTVNHIAAVSNTIKNMTDIIVDKHEKFQRNGSGWVFIKIQKLYVNIAQYSPLRGSSYVDLPQEIKNKKACINIKNTDNRCFKYCLAAALYPVQKNKERVGQYKDTIDLVKDVGVTYPVKYNDYTKFEKQNGININVFQWKKHLFPIYISEQSNEKTIDIMLYKEHYVLINNFNRLMYSFNKNKNSKHFCKRCLHCCSSADILKSHEERCPAKVLGKCIMPTEKDNKLFFKNYKFQMRSPFIIYADFECIIEAMQRMEGDENKTFKYQKHVPCSFGYHLVSIDKSFAPAPVIFRGENAHIKFVESLLKLQKVLLAKLKHVEPMQLTVEQEQDFQNSTCCHICSKDLKEDKVRDHCHITGEYRGGAHNKCNLNFQLNHEIPVLFHNLKNYDSHFIIRAFSKVCEKITQERGDRFDGEIEALQKEIEEMKDTKNTKDLTYKRNKLKKLNKMRTKSINIKCIPLNSEKYISFTIDKLRFIDSFQFMASSLESLSANLKKDVLKTLKKLLNTLMVNNLIF